MVPPSRNNNSHFETAWNNFYRAADLVLISDLESKSSSSKKDAHQHARTPANNKTKRDRRRRQRPRSAAAAALTPVLDQQNYLQHVSNIQSILQSLSNLLSSVDFHSKVYACQNGALRIVARGCDALLLLMMLQKNKEEDASIIMKINSALIVGLKTLQTCVFKNSVARKLCRSEDVLGLLKRIMTVARNNGNLLVFQESCTTLAAVCLGNDLNALIASFLFKEVLASASELPTLARSDTVRSTQNASRLDQTVTYLRKLFQVVQSEQQPLLDNFACFDHSDADLLERLTKAEKYFHTGRQLQTSCQWSQAELAYSRALDSLVEMMAHTNLLDELHGDLLDRRSTVRLELEAWQGALDDLSSLKVGNKNYSLQLKLVVRQADAFIGLRNFQKAQEALESAMQLNQEQPTANKMLSQKWNRLQLAKSKAVRSDSTPTRSQRTKKTSVEIKTASADLLAQTKGRQPEESDRHFYQTADAEECIDTIPAVKPGMCVNCLYGTGVVQEVRECGTTKIKLKSWSPGKQEPTAYLMPHFYTPAAIPGTYVNCIYGTGIIQEVRECGTTKIKLKSWSPGMQEPTAYLMPESYTVVAVSE